GGGGGEGGGRGGGREAGGRHRRRADRGGRFVPPARRRWGTPYSVLRTECPRSTCPFRRDREKDRRPRPADRRGAGAARRRRDRLLRPQQGADAAEFAGRREA